MSLLVSLICWLPSKPCVARNRRLFSKFAQDVKYESLSGARHKRAVHDHCLFVPLATFRNPGIGDKRASEFQGLQLH
eukprot:1658166-Amphidinium_carterae.1